MAVKHSTLTGSDLHEPKGITSAAANATYVANGDSTSGTWKEPEPKGIDTASDGDIYVADGAGSGAWTTPSGTTYGAMSVTQNATTQALTAASDATLNTDSDYAKVDTGIWATGEVDGITFNANGYLEIVTNGVYEVSFWASYKQSVTTVYNAFKFSTDDTNTTLSPRKLAMVTGSVGAVSTVAASAYVSLTAGDKISMWVAADKNTTMTMQDAGMTLVLLKAT